MADDATKQPDEKGEEKPTTVSDDTTSVPEAKKERKSKNLRKLVHEFPAWSWVIVAVVGFFAVFGCVAAVYAAVHSFSDGTDVSTNRRGDYSLRDDQFGDSSNDVRGGMQRGGGYGMMGGYGDSANTTSTRVNGVVIAVDGSTLTVAGNGTTTTVKVTDNTTYTGSSKPAAINDTITAFGTTSDGVFTATSVRLIRQ